MASKEKFAMALKLK